MLPIFDGVRDVTVLSTTLRMLLAVVCGGLIGLEREYKRRPAGFRTHILICLGAAMTTLTSQFLYLNLHYYTDTRRNIISLYSSFDSNPIAFAISASFVLPL